MSDDELDETTSVVSKVDNMKKERVCSHVGVKNASIRLLLSRSKGTLFLGYRIHQQKTGVRNVQSVYGQDHHRSVQNI